MNQYRFEDVGDGYVVHFFQPPGKALRSQISYEGTFIAQRNTQSHVAAAKWARKQIRDHRKAREILKGAR